MFYRLVRTLFRIVSAPMFRLRVEGRERVPRGPAILVAQHRSWLDPPLLAMVTGRPINFLVMESMYHKPWALWFYRRLPAIPVSSGAALGAMRRALRRLGQGELVGVFPQGRVVPEGRDGRFHPGAALLAAHAGAPVIPVAIEGSVQAWPRGRRLPLPTRVRVRVGTPIAPPAESGRRDVAEMARRIEEALRQDTPKARAV